MKGFSRFPLAGRGSALLAVACLVAACAAEPGGQGATPEERELERRAAAMQRTVFEGAAVGGLLTAAAGAIWGPEDRLEDRLRGVAAEAAVGAATGAAAGTYVAHLQQGYATREMQLNRLRADIDRTNAETAAAIETMRAVVAGQRRDLAAARARGAPDAVAAEEQRARRNLQTMTRLIGGAEDRLAAFQSTRGLGLVGGGAPGVDSGVAELNSRIAAMRQIATTLAGDI